MHVGSIGPTEMKSEGPRRGSFIPEVYMLIWEKSITVLIETLGHFSKIGFLKLGFFEQPFHGYLHNQGVTAINANCIYNLLLVSFYIYTQMQKELYISSV